MATASTVDIPNFYVFDEVTSTMDKAKEIIAETPGIERLAVVARSQSLGRGTRGRTWISPDSNLHITIAFRMSDVRTPLTLVPLRIGSLVCSTLTGIISRKESVSLKWPNDILINNDKVCGVLIEVENNYIVVGIGCNVFQSPAVQETGTDAGRQATCVWEHSTAGSTGDATAAVLDDDTKQQFIRGLGLRLYAAVSAWLDGGADSAERVVADVEAVMAKTPQRLRQANGAVHEGTEVLPIRINSDGSLEVRIAETGQMETLYTEYMW